MDDAHGHQAGADALARLVRVIRETLRPDDTVALITFSARVARIGPDEERSQTITRADAAMYQTKRAGKNRVVASA